jgi:hypothetical protein
LFEVGVKNGEDDDMWFRIFTYYSIAISKISTTVYDRSNCGATSSRGSIAEPFFMRRIEGILSDREVLTDRKNSILLWVEQNKLSRVRQYILAGEKKEAVRLFKQIDFKRSNKKRYLQTLMCMGIPSKMIRKYIDARDYGYYGGPKTGESR